MSHFVISYNDFTGDITGWVLPASPSYSTILYSFTHLNITGDITNWIIPNKTFEILNSNVPLTGDLSGWVLPDGLEGFENSIVFSTGTHITKMPRGNFRRIIVFNFSANNCDTAEIDDLLADIDAYFVGGIVPLVNCVYTLNGTGMGIPSAAGLTSKQNIINKYTAASKTCTIAVNS